MLFEALHLKLTDVFNVQQIFHLSKSESKSASFIYIAQYHKSQICFKGVNSSTAEHTVHRFHALSNLVCLFVCLGLLCHISYEKHTKILLHKTYLMVSVLGSVISGLCFCEGGEM